jgi:hypothetical protein
VVFYVEFFSQRRQTHLPESYAGRIAILRGVRGDKFFAREQPANTYVLKKADRLVRTAGSAAPAN